MADHGHWVRQIDAELDNELSLPERAALAHHLAGCPACAGARASHLEVRLALARSTGQPLDRPFLRPAFRARHAAAWVLGALVLGVLAGWLADARWGGPGPGSLEASRAAFVVE